MNKQRKSYKRQIRANQSLQNLSLILLILLVVLGLIKIKNQQPIYIHPEIIDFSSIKNFELRKQTFIDFLVPKIKKHNQKMLEKRKEIEQLIANKETKGLCQIAISIRLSCSKLNLEKELLKRFDTIPPAIVLAQAILESGWGTSRFSKEALNLFGMWCFNQGCGIVPNMRDDNKSHEIRSYATINQSIEDYFEMINFGNSFKQFRERRSQSKNLKSSSQIYAMTEGLKNYSGIESKEYIERVRKIIFSESLLQYN